MHIDLQSIWEDSDFLALRDEAREGEDPRYTPRRRVMAGLLYLSRQPEQIPHGQKNAFYEGLGRACGCGLKQAMNLWSGYKRSGWRGLVDGRSLPRPEQLADGARSLRFRQWVQRLAEGNQLSTQRAVEFVHDALRYGMGRPIPGFEAWQPCGKTGALPPGTSATSLRSILKKHELANIRQGLKTNHAALPMVLTTRRGVRPGTVYEFDDMWHDHLVMVEGQREPVRVLEFGALDVASACRIHWGFCPRIIRDDGSKQGLTKAMFVLFLAYVLHVVGFAKEGVTLVLEHATASIDKDLRALLEGAGLGIRIRESGIVGTVQAGMGGYSGAIGGNPRGKTHIEVSHAAIHKINAFLPGQVGKDRQHMQESTLGRIREARQLGRYVDMLREAGRHDLAEAIQMPFLTINEFSEFLKINYWLWNNRTDHALEGWSDRVVKELRLGGNWIKRSDLLADETAELAPALLAQVAENPGLMRIRKMSPAEVWEGERGEWQRIPMGLYIEMIKSPKVCGRKLRVRHGQLQAQDKLLCMEPIIYSARVYTPDKRVYWLAEGDEYQCVINPFDLAHLVVLDTEGRVLGLCEQLARASVDDEEAIHHLTGKVAAAKAALLADQKARWAGDTARERNRHDRNISIFAEAGLPVGKPGTARRLQAPSKALAVPVQEESGVDVFAGLSLPAADACDAAREDEGMDAPIDYDFL